MDRRDMDRQLKSLSFDMDEEIDDRNERRGWQSSSIPHAHRPMDTSHAIILAAIIVVGGLWGGKLLYDYIQEQRMKAAINEAAMYMQQTFKQANQQLKKSQSEVRQRAAADAKVREQKFAEDQAQKQAEILRAQQEKRFQSAQCQFWWQQHSENPSERTAKKRADSCGV